MHKHTITATTITSADFKVTGKTSTRTVLWYRYYIYEGRTSK